MLPDLPTAVATERQKDLRAAAARSRLAAAAAPPAALRLRLGRQLVSIGLRIAEPSRLVHHPSSSFIGEEEGLWKSF